MEHTIKIKEKAKALKVYDSLLAFLKTLGINLSGGKSQKQKTGTRNNKRRLESFKYPLEGTLLKYDDPFGPAANISNWDAAK